jgi:hypothetical protein
MRNKLCWLRAVLLIAPFFALASPALGADFVVIGSIVVGSDYHTDFYKPGQRLSDDTIIELGRCEILTLQTQNHFVSLYGAYRGTIRSYRMDLGRLWYGEILWSGKGYTIATFVWSVKQKVSATPIVLRCFDSLSTGNVRH